MQSQQDDSALERKKEQEQRVHALLAKLLTPEAAGRLSNIRMSNEDLYTQVIQFVVTLYTQGRLKGKLSEPELKSVVTRLLSEKKESKITFLRK